MNDKTKDERVKEAIALLRSHGMTVDVGSNVASSEDPSPVPISVAEPNSVRTASSAEGGSAPEIDPLKDTALMAAVEAEVRKRFARLPPENGAFLMPGVRKMTRQDPQPRCRKCKEIVKHGVLVCPICMATMNAAASGER